MSNDIWTLSYTVKHEITLEEKEKQKMIDSQTRALSSAFAPGAGLTPVEYSAQFYNHFLLSRRKANELADQAKYVTRRYSEAFQVGNAESLAEINRIEQSPNFLSWDNPLLVEDFKTLSNNT
jgi:hypothetical protein